MEPPAKKIRTLLDDEDSSEADDDSGGVVLSDQLGNEQGLKINEEYARRFEYNKKREEIQQLEAKLGKTSTLEKRRNRDDDNEISTDESGDSSEDEEEDEDGELITQALDAEIQATLKAIRSKDPRVYDKSVSFFSNIEEDDELGKTQKQEKPMFLRDYHRQNLLNGTIPNGDANESPKTFAQEQEDLKNAIIKEMHAAAVEDEESASDGAEDGDGGFLIRKSTTIEPRSPTTNVELDVKNADKDPETFLSNFMASKAWVPRNRSELHPFESDDDEELERAEAFEEAYNFRFEDPHKINEKLITHSRDATAKISVRREKESSRKKQRDAEKSKRDEEKKQRETEKSRLRKLKVEELQNKIQTIKEVAGLRASELTDEEWVHFLDGSWDHKEWETEMQKRFGEDYYAQVDDGNNEDERNTEKKHPKKPTWDDDIDIKDLVPDFDDDQGNPGLDDYDLEMAPADRSEDDDGSESNKKSKAEEKRDKRREARKEHLRIEEAVERNLDLDISLLPGATKKNSAGFRYRETSPQSFGLTAQDILMADDSQLNQFAGLKKLASFRDPEKKRRDQKKLGKKARLRQWRKDVFGDDDGPAFKSEFQQSPGAEEQHAKVEDSVDLRSGSKKKKRKRSKKH